MPHVLVVGGSGHLGREVVGEAIRAGWRVSATHRSAPAGDSSATWHRLDLSSRTEVEALLAALRPDVVLNAGYRQSDWTVTADGPAYLAVSAVAVGARLVHVSSDVVFSGRSSPYVETDVPDPISPYGAAKSAAETAVRAVDPSAVVARTSLILGGRSPHEQRVRELVTGEIDGVLFTDDVRCPVDVGDLAAALLELAVGDHAGIAHVAGPDAVSRHELGLLVARREGLDAGRLRAGRRAELGPPAPLDLRLDSTATQALLRTRLRGARELLV